MNYQKKAIVIINSIMLCAMLFGLVAPAAQMASVYAQEATEEAAATVTEAPVETATVAPTATSAPPTQTPPPTATTVVTQEPAPQSTEMVAPEATAEVTQEAVVTETNEPEATAEVTTEPDVTSTPAEVTPTAVPTTDPAATIFEDDFEDGDTSEWTLSPGWGLTADGDNMLLRGVIPDAEAAITDLDWPHLNMSARLRVQAGSSVDVIIRKSDDEGYRVTLNADGLTTLSRGDTVLAEGTAPETTDDDQAVWRKLIVQALGNQVIVSLDDVIQFTYDDPTPLEAGGVAFVTGTDNTGAVDIDDVVINKLEASVIVTPPAPQPEITPEVTAEVTEEPEATAEVTAEPEATAEVTEEPASVELVPVPVLSADFEDGMGGLAASEGAVTVAVDDTNHALLINPGSSVAPATEIQIHNLRLDSRVNFVNAAGGGLSVMFRTSERSSYVLDFAADQTTLMRSDSNGVTPLVGMPAERTTNVWYNVSLDAIDGQIRLTVDGAEVFSFADDVFLEAGSIALVANGETSVFVDDVALYEMIPQDQLTTPTPLPVYTLTDETAVKLPSALHQVLSLYEAGDQEAAFALAAETNIVFLDDALNVDVVIWPTPESQTISAVIEANGGVITAIHEKTLDVRIPLSDLIALIASDEVAAVRLPEVVTSTSASLSTALSPAEQGGSLLHTLAIIGWNDWNQSSITGSGVKVAVIDKAGSHRNAVVELLQTVAPGANVKTYNAENTNQLRSAIQSARNDNNKVILITLDLGAHVSPGDGTSGGLSGSNNVYSQIQSARQEGRLVIASAGNNTGRYVSFSHTTATTVTMTVDPGPYVVNVSWNGWSDNGQLPSTLNVSTGGNFNSPNRASGEAPGYQFSGNCNSGCTLTLNISGSSGKYVQVQLNSPGAITNVTGSTVNEDAGNIARPADSPYALAVGAVCSVYGEYPPLTDSSHGPIFATGGSNAGPSAITNTREDYKPDLVAPSHVYSSVYGDPDYNCDLGPATGGFNGTSAAAAHVAGMAALLLSNSSMNAHIANASNPANALENYLQTHTVDLFESTADFDGDYGFDNLYGAGLTQLGDPSYNLAQVSNPLNEGGNAIYVGQGAPGSAQTGEFDKPFLHISKAIDEAINQTKNRVVLLPGEYLSGLGIIGVNDMSIEGYNGQATIWVNDHYKGQAGIHIENSTAITIDGLQFEAADPVKVEGIPYIFPRPVALQFFNNTLTDAGNSIVRSSTFSGFVNKEPVIINATYNISIFNSIFEDISTSGVQLNRAAMLIMNSNSSTDRIMLQGNTFRNIAGTVQASNNATYPGIPMHESIIRIENSAVDIFSNYFLNTNAESIFAIVNSAADGTNLVNIVSNLFVYNNNLIAHLNPAPEVRFVNNTVAEQNTPDLNSMGALLKRTTGTSTDMPWDVHNNLFYNNPGYRITWHEGVFSLCNTLDSAGAEMGARHNWVVNTRTTLEFSTATCDKSFYDNNTLQPQNNNIIVDTPVDPATIFVGADPAFNLDPTSDALYYQLRQDATGIDAGNVNLTVEPYIDFAQHIRSSDANGDEVDDPDIGAFELVPLSAGPIELVRQEDIFDQPNDRSTAFGIDLSQGVEGGFAPYVFKIKSLPDNFSTDPSDYCLGKGLRFEGNFAFYCPPQHFYTDDGNPNLPDNVVFEYYAFDKISDQNNLEEAAFSTVTIDIASQVGTDIGLTTPINYQMIAEAGTAFKFRLRPFVRFDNFRFSEWGTPRNNEAQYPFIYNTDIQIVDYENPSILQSGGSTIEALEAYIETQLNNPNADGTITLQSTNGERGFVEFTYGVSDSHTPQGSITNSVYLQVVGTLPDRGLHDDSSFSFRYANINGGSDGWQPISSPANINNTLHQTKKLDDVATFDFVGESFVIYMQAINRGSQWELRIDDKEGVNPPLEWAQQPDGSYIAQADGYNCITRAKVSNNLISNNGKNLYTVSCDGLRDGESHAAQIINRQNKNLAVDAFAILFDADPLLPGFHEVTEHDLASVFAGWPVITDKKASSQVAVAAPSALVDDATFTFTGTGVAIGTTLQRVKGPGGVYVGVDYDICITPQVDGAAGEEVCQNFNNANGASKGVTWGVFRPFFGYSYDATSTSPDVHEVRIHINDLPDGAQLIIDSIVVFGDMPTETLSLIERIYEDDNLGPIVLGNGDADSWLLNTRNRNASNKSLTGLAKKVVAAGPFISFNVPDATDTIHWYRQTGKRDSQSILVCVDRAQGETGIAQHCRTYNLRATTNPLIINETDFVNWGDAWGDDTIHSVEIFSLTDETFNFDKIEIYDNAAPFAAGWYEGLVLKSQNIAYGFFDETAGNPRNGGSFRIVQDKSASKASAKSVVSTSTAGEGAWFEMTGTGFTVYFTQNKQAGDVKICWLESASATDIASVETLGSCQTHTNYNGTTKYKVGHTVVGLPENDYTVTVRNVTYAPKGTSQMILDAIEVLNDALPGAALSIANARYEPSFEQQAIQDLFLYYGDWSTTEGQKARGFSAENYDSVNNAPGAAIVFQTDGIDILQIINTAKSSFADFQVCIDGTNDCTPFTGNSDPVVVHLPDTDPHVVSLIVTSDGNFQLDAIDTYDGTTPLPPGLYEADNPLLQYESEWNNKSSATYTNRRAQRTTIAGTDLLFHMQGSILELGAFVSSYDQVEICYQTGIETNPDNVTSNCATYPANSGQSLSDRQLPTTGVMSDDVAIYTVRVRNLANSELLIDYVKVLDSFNPLAEGRYENTHPVVTAGLNGSWINEVSKNSSAGGYARTHVPNDVVQFEIEGTGFGIGTFADQSGSDMNVCYLPSSETFDGTWDGVGETCVVYQNETASNSVKITRAITGLPYDIYTVGVVNFSDGLSAVTGQPRDVSANPPTLVLDFVEVYDGAPEVLTIADAGTYNEDAEGNQAYMQLLPADRWTLDTSRDARDATENSYVGVIDDSERVTDSYAGQSATFAIELPPNSVSTLVVDLLEAHSKNSDRIQYCVIGEESETSIDCEVLTTAQSQRYQAITVENTTESTVTRTISLSNLTPGFFRIDSFQYIPGDTLGGGVYEDVLMDTTTTIFDTGASTGWTFSTSDKFSNGSIYQSTVADDSVQFEVTGTGFAIGTHTGPNAGDVEICYQDESVFDGDFEDPEDQCLTFANRDSSGSTTISRSVVGLPESTYVVGVFNRDDSLATPENPSTLIIDYVEVFDTALPPVLGVNASGDYNEDAADANDPYLQLLPASRWETITDKSANNATSGSYAGIVDGQGKVSSSFAGPTATLRINVEAGSRSILTMDTLTTGKGTSDQMLYCVLDGMTLVDECDVLQTMPNSNFQVVAIDNTGGAEDTVYTIFFQTLTPGYFRIDNFQLLQKDTLGAGIFEDMYISEGGLIQANGASWAQITSSKYTNGSAVQTTGAAGMPPSTPADFVEFEFTGTGFAIGTHTGKTGSEMRVCYYLAGESHVSFFDGIDDEECVDFQNEAKSTNLKVMRSITGLPQDTYMVGVLHLDDGFSNLGNVPEPRSASNPATLVIDYIQIYDEPDLSYFETGGTWNEDATELGVPYIQLLPADRWGPITGKAAKNATEQSYVSLVDNRGRVDKSSTGPTATIGVRVDPDSTMTIALNTFASGSGHSNQLQYCVLFGYEIVECNVSSSMSYSTNQVVTVQNESGETREYTIFFQTLTPGYFRIDGIQAVDAGVLTEGLYDNHFMSDGGLIDLDGVWELPPSKATKVKKAIGGDIIRTQTQNSAMTFTFTGSGFSVITIEDSSRLGIEACFVKKTDYDLTGFDTEICRLNSPEVNKGKFEQYGLSFYGLQPDTYVARVTVTELATNLKKQWFTVDALVIFGDITDGGALQPGMYDDSELLENSAVRFAPALFWETNPKVKNGPPKGPWQLTEQQAKNSGAVLQVFVQGNTLTLYQQISNKNTNDVLACLVVFGTQANELQCNNFSQKGKGGYLTPIAFFGLGDGSHEIVLENKTPKKRFNIDAIRVTP